MNFLVKFCCSDFSEEKTQGHRFEPQTLSAVYERKLLGLKHVLSVSAEKRALVRERLDRGAADKDLWQAEESQLQELDAKLDVDDSSKLEMSSQKKNEIDRLTDEKSNSAKRLSRSIVAHSTFIRKAEDLIEADFSSDVDAQLRVKEKKSLAVTENVSLSAKQKEEALGDLTFSYSRVVSALRVRYKKALECLNLGTTRFDEAQKNYLKKKAKVRAAQLHKLPKKSNIQDNSSGSPPDAQQTSSMVEESTKEIELIGGEMYERYLASLLDEHYDSLIDAIHLEHETSIQGLTNMHSYVRSKTVDRLERLRRRKAQSRELALAYMEQDERSAILADFDGEEAVSSAEAVESAVAEIDSEIAKIHKAMLEDELSSSAIVCASTWDTEYLDLFDDSSFDFSDPSALRTAALFAMRLSIGGGAFKLVRQEQMLCDDPIIKKLSLSSSPIKLKVEAIEKAVWDLLGNCERNRLCVAEYRLRDYYGSWVDRRVSR